MRMIARLGLALVMACCSCTAALAAPSRVIILRHGEKDNAWKLCGVGEDRAAALAATYLGRDPGKSLFGHAEAPAAFLAITLHTLELAAPSAAAWSLPITLYAAPPGGEKKAFEETLNRRTREAAAALFANPAWQGKTVVMVWEHKHIADAKLEKNFPGEAVTLRQLLHLDALKDVPKTWPAGTYDYFWIVDFADGASTPTGFRMVKQEFGKPYKDVPQNDWGAPNGLTADTKCNLKGAD
jgi:hypothetical protein